MAKGWLDREYAPRLSFGVWIRILAGLENAQLRELLAEALKVLIERESHG